LHMGFKWGNLRKRNHLEDLSGDGRIILKQNFMKWDGKHGTDWIHLAEDRDTWLILVNAVMNLQVP